VPRPLEKREIADRLHAFPRDIYTFIGGINKGIALALATVAFLPLISDLLGAVDEPAGTQSHYRLGPWFASMSALIVAQVTWNRGVIFTNARASLLDTVLPLVMGLFEVALFAVLIDGPSRIVPPDFWHNWFYVMAGHSLTACALVLNRIRNTDLEHDFDRSLRGLAREYCNWTRQDAIGSGVSGGIALAVGLTFSRLVWQAPMSERPWAEPIFCGLAVLIALALWVKPIRDADRQRRYAEYFVSSTDAPPLSFAEWCRPRRPRAPLA